MRAFCKLNTVCDETYNIKLSFQCHKCPLSLHKFVSSTRRFHSYYHIENELWNLMSVWSTSSVGLDVGVSVANNNKALDNNKKLHYRSHHKCKMSQSGDELNTPRYLSWRKLHLSRAKLKASGKTSALLSGFAMVAMVELQLQNNQEVPGPVLVVFAVITTLLVAVHMLALMISTCILPNIEAICSLDAISLVDESPHERLHWYIETAWAFSTLLGLLLFLAEIALICYVKFYGINDTASWSACVVLVPFFFVFLAFAIHFYRSLVSHKYEMYVSGIRELELLKEQIEQGDVGDNRTNGAGNPISGIHIV